MPFQNPIVAGDGELIRESIQSPDYVPGVSGWAIRRDGSAEFGGVAMRGTVAVTDPDGSAVYVFTPPGVTPEGGRALVQLKPAPRPDGLPITSGYVYAGYSSAVQQTALVLLGPAVNGGQAPRFRLGALADRSMRADLLADEFVVELFDGAEFWLGPLASRLLSLRPDLIEWDGDLNVFGSYRINGKDLGGGPVGRAASTGNSPGFQAETSLLSIAGLTFVAGRAYRVRFGGAFTMTAPGIVRARLRDRTTAFTADWGDLGHYPATFAGNAFRLEGTAYLRRFGPGSLTGQTLALTLSASVAGTIHTGSVTSPRWLEIVDCGEAVDYPDAVAV